MFRLCFFHGPVYTFHSCLSLTQTWKAWRLYRIVLDWFRSSLNKAILLEKCVCSGNERWAGTDGQMSTTISISFYFIVIFNFLILCIYFLLLFYVFKTYIVGCIQVSHSNFERLYTFCQNENFLYSINFLCLKFYFVIVRNVLWWQNKLRKSLKKDGGMSEGYRELIRRAPSAQSWKQFEQENK